MMQNFSGWSGRFRSAQLYLLTHCPPFKILQTVHTIAREPLSYLQPLCNISVGRFLNASLMPVWTCKLRGPGIPPSQLPASLCPAWGCRKCPGSCWGAVGLPGDLAVGAGDALPPVCRAPETHIPMKPLPRCLQQRRTTPASWQARRVVSKAGRGTIRKISLARSLASAWCQRTGRLRGGGMAGCCWDQPSGPGDNRVPSLILRTE